MAESVDVGVVGGGVIGLSIAYELAGRAVRVAVLDASPLGRAASWAGAGMLAPVPVRPPSDPWGALRARSLALQADWASDLRRETGLDTGYRLCGGLDVVMSDEEALALERRRPVWETEGVVAERVEGADLRLLEPEVSNQGVRWVYHFPGRAQVRNPWHLRALAEGCRRRGVAIHVERPLEGFVVEGRRIQGLRTPRGPISCGAAVVAAGPWTAPLLALLDVEAPTPPLRGQIVLLRWPAPRLKRIVERGHAYLVPRDDGRVLVGSTEEWAGYDPRPTADGVAGLLEFAGTVCPGLRDAEFEGAWAGLRPASRDGAPYIGRIAGFDNLHIAAGHRRVGVQMAPGTAEFIADLIVGRAPRWDPAAFAIERPPPRLATAFDS